MGPDHGRSSRPRNSQPRCQTSSGMGVFHLLRTSGGLPKAFDGTGFGKVIHLHTADTAARHPLTRRKNQKRLRKRKLSRHELRLGANSSSRPPKRSNEKNRGESSLTSSTSSPHAAWAHRLALPFPGLCFQPTHTSSPPHQPTSGLRSRRPVRAAMGFSIRDCQASVAVVSVVAATALGT